MSYQISVRTALLLIVALTFLPYAAEVDARGTLFADKSGSTAFMEMKTQDPDALAAALIRVFIADGYGVTSERNNQIQFARLASRMQELSYGTPLNPGSLEAVTIDFFPISQKAYRVECNVTIISGERASAADANILPLFGRQYKRMLRRVKRKLR